MRRYFSGTSSYQWYLALHPSTTPWSTASPAPSAVPSTTGKKKYPRSTTSAPTRGLPHARRTGFKSQTFVRIENLALPPRRYLDIWVSRYLATAIRPQHPARRTHRSHRNSEGDTKP